MPRTYVANGNIKPSTIVCLDASTSWRVIAAVGNTQDSTVIGIAQDGPYQAPGVTGSGAYAAAAGIPLEVYTCNDICLLLLGANCNAGDYLKADANAAGTPASLSANTEQDIIAKAEQAGITGDLVRVVVLSPTSSIAHV